MLVNHLQKNKERVEKFKETEDSQYINQNELDNACFQHCMGYGDFKNLTRRTASDKILRDKTFDIAKNKKNVEYQRGLVSMVYNFLIANKLAEELHKPIIRKIKEGKVPSPFIDNIGGAYLADMQLINKF